MSVHSTTCAYAAYKLVPGRGHFVYPGPATHRGLVLAKAATVTIDKATELLSAVSITIGDKTELG